MHLFKTKQTRITGVLFLLSLFTPMLNWTLINSKILIVNNPSETVQRVIDNQSIFRLGLVNDLIISIIAIFLAFFLYRILNHVNKTWAQIAFVLKITEGVLLATISLVHLSVFLVITNSDILLPTEFEKWKLIVGVFLNTRMAMTSVPMFFLGLNFTIFLTLLYKSNLVPRKLAAFGIISYILIFLYSLLTLLAPHTASNVIIQSLCWAPSCLFELIIGIWLLIKE